MRDRPNGAELLAEAGRLLGEELAPQLSGEQRYMALLVAAAVNMVRRELEVGDGWQAVEADGLRALLGESSETGGDTGSDLERLNAALAGALRAGAFDGDPQVHKVLLACVEGRVAESNPKALHASA